MDSVFYGMRYQVPALLACGGGAIVNISSIYGMLGAPGSITYAAAKHAVIGMTVGHDGAHQCVRSGIPDALLRAEATPRTNESAEEY